MKEQVQTNPAAGSEMAAKKTQHQKIVAMVQIALFAAIIAVCSWIQIPMTVPFTMQTFAVFCALATLGGKGGTISVLIYIVLGAVGVPVFAGFTGGVGILFGTTGGYIIGFLFTGLLYWLITHFLGDKLPVMILALVLGLALLITCQALLHVMVTVNLMPETGQTLPLISRGGSSVLFTVIALGMILSVSRQNDEHSHDTPRSESIYEK